MADIEHSALLATLDLKSKVALLTGASMFTLAPEASIGLTEIRLSDAGVRGLKFSGGPQAALFPNATLLAAAWSEQTAYEVGRLLAEEAMAQRIHVVLGPNINLHRSPLGGRLFEAYSEDPLLTGRLAAAYVRGLQDLGVGACLKHLVANESETERNTVNCVVDEATLREVYLLPFEIAVHDADPWSMMAAYNDVTGCRRPSRTTSSTASSRASGATPAWSCPTGSPRSPPGPPPTAGSTGPHGPWGDALVAAVQAGDVPEAVVDEHVRRLLVLAERVGALGQPRAYPETLPAPGSPQRRQQLTRLAAEGMTVLTNRDNALPLARDRSVALIGRHAVETIDMGGGSAQVNPPYQISVAEGLTALLGDAVTVTDGVEVRTRPVAARGGFLVDPETGKAGVQVTLIAADGSVVEERHAPAATTAIGVDDGLAGIVATARFCGRISAAGRVEVGAIGVGSWQVRAGDGSFEYELRTSGEGLGQELLAPPTGVDVVEVPADTMLEATVALQPPEAGRPLAGVGLFGVIARAAPRDPDTVIAEAARAAAAADVAVVVVGLSEEEETEAVDKATLRPPGRQDDLVRAVAAAARRTVVVVNAATPVLMPWLDEVDAVLWAGLPGQEGGHAVAAALLGDIEPAGRLVTTFPTADGAAPAWSVTPVDGRLDYREGPFIGYRGHHAGRAPSPTFWFGHGLGYGTWEYADVQVLPGDGAPTVRVTVTNTGDRDSREVVQVYLRPAEPDQPVCLVGWESTQVRAGASVTLDVRTDERMWRRWDTATNTWTPLAAGGQLLLARGLGDVRATIGLSPTDG